jgi:RimJ/RimL family protein N-acetyltransferase
MLTLRTPRLELVAATWELIDAQLHDPRQCEAILDGRLPEGWPPELTEDVWEYMARQLLDPDAAGWWMWYFVRCGPGARVAVGSGGFKGPPAADGTVEVGYSVMPAWRRAGYAAEAVAGLIGWAAGTGRVRRVIAHTYPHLVPSVGVLTKLGFELDGPGEGEGTLRYELAVTAR